MWTIPLPRFRERLGTTVTEVRAVVQRYAPPRRLRLGGGRPLLEYESEWEPIGPE